MLPHCLDDHHGLLGQLAFLTGAGVSNGVGHHSLQRHCLEHLRGLLGLLARFTGADQASVGEEVNNKLPRCLDPLQGLLGLGADQGSEGDADMHKLPHCPDQDLLHLSALRERPLGIPRTEPVNAHRLLNGVLDRLRSQVPEAMLIASPA